MEALNDPAQVALASCRRHSELRSQINHFPLRVRTALQGERNLWPVPRDRSNVASVPVLFTRGVVVPTAAGFQASLRLSSRVLLLVALRQLEDYQRPSSRRLHLCPRLPL